jgi:ATP-dependent RNA helicase SUPV3L1/SUV3
VRFGAYYIYLPNLVKPAIRVLATQLWALRQGGSALAAGLDEIPQLAASGRTSFLADAAIPRDTYRVAGFRLCGDRAVRVDIVERLADLIRPAVAYRPGVSAGAPPPGSADGDGFVVTGAMTSLTGCSGESFASVLRSLGFVSRQAKGPVLRVVQSAPEAAQPVNGFTDPAPDAEPPESLSGSAEAANADEDRTALPPGDDEVRLAADLAAVVTPVATASEAPAPQGAAEASEAPAPEGVGAESEALAPDGPAATSESPVSDGAAAMSEASALEGVVATAPAEDVLIEVWSPRPSGRPRIPRREAKDRAPARAEPAPEGEAQPERRGETADRTAGRRRPHFSAPPPVSVETAPPKEEARGFRGGRGNRRRFDNAGNGDVAPGRRSGPRKGGAPDERRPETPAAPAPRREPPINLDSPFAKLLALKTQLEAKSKGG